MDLKALDEAVGQVFAYGPSRLKDQKLSKRKPPMSNNDKAKTAGDTTKRRSAQTKSVTKDDA